MKLLSLTFTSLAVVLSTVAFAEAESSGNLASILAENPDPFVDIDAAEIISKYGSAGSGIDLVLGGIPIQRSNVDLTSEASSIAGATNIFGDPDGFGFTIGLSGDYLFDFDKATLKQEAIVALQKVLALYGEYEGKEIQIEGHTDSKGSDQYNQKLSERRASSVEEWFVANNLDASFISTKGYGESKPVAKNSINGKDNPEGRALNRRVEIKVTTAKKVNYLPLTTQ